MRIIKEGKIPNKKVIFKCPKCGTIFEVNDGEYSYSFVKTTIFIQYYTLRDKYESVCPLCKYEGEMNKMRYEYVEV